MKKFALFCLKMNRQIPCQRRALKNTAGIDAESITVWELLRWVLFFDRVPTKADIRYKPTREGYAVQHRFNRGL